MKKILSQFFNRELDFRVRLFHVMALGGVAISFFTLVISLFTQMWMAAVISALLIVLSMGLLIFTMKTGRYQIAYGITIVIIFMIFLPMLFFASGGYKSGMPSIFLFAVLFTVLMLRGKSALWLSLAETIEYILVCIFTYYHPEYVNHYDTEAAVLTDILFAYSCVSLICGIVLYVHFKEYDHEHLLLREKNEQLKRYDASRSTFLTTVSHEIKNPLNAINLHARDTRELLEETPLELRLVKENQQVIEEMVVRIDRILMDLKDTVAIEQGRLSLSLTQVQFSDLIRESCHAYFGKGYNNGNQLKLELDENLGPISADYARITQVMTNLLSNAIQHTKDGIITVSLVSKEDCQEVCVADNGEGMSDAMLEKVFKGYVSTNEDYWRHGIGLYICSQIVEAHDGRIWIESKRGVGTKVFFALPNKEN